MFAEGHAVVVRKKARIEKYIKVCEKRYQTLRETYLVRNRIYIYIYISHRANFTYNNINISYELLLILIFQLNTHIINLSSN